MKDIHDAFTHAEFGDDRLGGSGVVAGQISAFPIDFAGRPYNTLTLPCERVIFVCGWSDVVDQSLLYCTGNQCNDCNSGCDGVNWSDCDSMHGIVLYTL